VALIRRPWWSSRRRWRIFIQLAASASFRRRQRLMSRNCSASESSFSTCQSLPRRSVRMSIQRFRCCALHPLPMQLRNLLFRHVSVRNPSSVPSASRANASNSFQARQFIQVAQPDLIKNSFDVLSKSAAHHFLASAVVISFLSSSSKSRPTIHPSNIRNLRPLTGCLYAITASVSSAGIESRREAAAT